MALSLVGVVTAGAAWYFLIRENAELASDPPQIPAALLNATATPTSAASTAGSTATSAPAPSAAVGILGQAERSPAAYLLDSELGSVGSTPSAMEDAMEVLGAVDLIGDGNAPT